MAKKDGEHIAIKFDHILTGDVSGNEDKFTVSFNEYDMVPDGQLVDATRDVESLTLRDIEQLAVFDPSSGTYTDTQNDNGTIILAEEEE